MKTTQYAYDDWGNLYSKRTEQDHLPDGTSAPIDFFGLLKNNINSTVELYSYDGFNRLQEVRKGGTTVSYVYNAEGIRTSKTVNGTMTEFLLDGANVVAETKNGSTTNYIRGLTGIISSSIQGTNNTAKYYTSDGHGNITKLTDSTGTIVKTYTYDAFGVEQNIDSNDTNPFRYCGEYYDSEIEQIYLRARYYDPSLGRFTQADPARDGMNWYVYCSGNPILYIDPSGLVSVIFYANNEETKGQAEVRKAAYEDYYGTDCYIIAIGSASQFVAEWNKWFSDYLAGETIDAIEIISHGSAVDKKAGSISTGFLYFTEDGKNNRLFARRDSAMKDGDYYVGDLCFVKAKGLNINACNGANPDLYSMVSGFFRQGSYDYITGWDGGVTWDGKQAIRGGGDFNPWLPDPWYPVKSHQATYWKNVEKDWTGAPVRERVGKRVFSRNADGTYVQIE